MNNFCIDKWMPFCYCNTKYAFTMTNIKCHHCIAQLLVRKKCMIKVMKYFLFFCARKEDWFEFVKLVWIKENLWNSQIFKLCSNIVVPVFSFNSFQFSWVPIWNQLNGWNQYYTEAKILQMYMSYVLVQEQQLNQSIGYMFVFLYFAKHIS